MNKVQFKKNNIVYAEIYDFNTVDATRTEFFSSDENPLQFGILVYEKGHKVQSHKHKNMERINREFCEATFVLSGDELVNIYDDEHIFVGSHHIRKNHLLVVYKGYHSMDVLTDFKALEFKLGPFIADDKEYAN